MSTRCLPKIVVPLTVLCLVALATPLSQGGNNGTGNLYEVTVTNLTRGQIFSPPVAVTHDPAIGLFTPGQPASPELAALAEDADAAGLLALLSTLPQVADVEVGAGVILPGHSASLLIETQGKRRQLSIVGMLVTTNDAFYAAGGRLDGDGMLRGIAWDAGSEGNTEDCDHIPGPPCGNPGVHVPATAEGYVHVHAGVHGIADLSAAEHDWRNPTVRVVVREISNDDEGSED